LALALFRADDGEGFFQLLQWPILTTPLLLAELFALFSSISRLFSPKSFL
jgi:hypothetical protein